MVPESTLRAALGKTLQTTDLVGHGEKYDGKVRDCYVGKDEILLVATDRLSAFDRILTTALQGSGLEPTLRVVVREDEGCGAEPPPRRPRPERLARPEVRAPAGRARGARVHHGGHVDHHLDGVRTGRARLLRSPAPRRAPQEPAARGAHPDAGDEGPEGGARRSASRDGDPREGRISPKDFDTVSEMAMTLFARGPHRGAERDHPRGHEVRGRSRPTGESSSSTRSTRPTRRASGTRRATRKRSARETTRKASTRSTCGALVRDGAIGATARLRRWRRRPRGGGTPLHRGVRALDGDEFEANTEQPLGRIEQNLRGRA